MSRAGLTRSRAHLILAVASKLTAANQQAILLYTLFQNPPESPEKHAFLRARFGFETASYLSCERLHALRPSLVTSEIAAGGRFRGTPTPQQCRAHSARVTVQTNTASGGTATGGTRTRNLRFTKQRVAL